MHVAHGGGNLYYFRIRGITVSKIFRIRIPRDQANWYELVKFRIKGIPFNVLEYHLMKTGIQIIGIRNR